MRKKRHLTGLRNVPMSHLKSSSMSITLTSRDLEEMSFLCFIYLSFFQKRKLLPCPSPSSSCASWSSSSWSSGQVVASCAQSRLKNSMWKFLSLFRCFRTERNISVWNVWLACLQDFQDFLCLAVRVFYITMLFRLLWTQNIQKAKYFYREGKTGTPNDSPLTSRLGSYDPSLTYPKKLCLSNLRSHGSHWRNMEETQSGISWVSDSRWW